MYLGFPSAYLSHRGQVNGHFLTNQGFQIIGRRDGLIPLFSRMEGLRGGLIPLDRNWCLASSYTRTHIQCLCVRSPRRIRNSCPALCRTSPSLLKSFYFTIPTKSDSSPHQGVCPALCTSCCVWTTEPPQTATTILQGLLLPFTLHKFVQCDPFPLSLIGTAGTAYIKLKTAQTGL